MSEPRAMKIRVQFTVEMTDEEAKRYFAYVDDGKFTAAALAKKVRAFCENTSRDAIADLLLAAKDP